MKIKKLFLVLPFIFNLALGAPCQPVNGCDGIANNNANTEVRNAPMIFNGSASSEFSLDSSSKGARPWSRLTQTIGTTIPSPDLGLTFYDTTLNTIDYFDGLDWQNVLSIGHLIQGANMTITDNGDGTVTFASTGGGSGPTQQAIGSFNVSTPATTVFTGVNALPINAGTLTAVQQVGTTVSLANISGQTTPIITSTLAGTHIENFEFDATLTSTDASVTQYTATVRWQQNGGGLISTLYQQTIYLGGSFRVAPFTISGLLPLNQGDYIYVVLTSNGAGNPVSTNYSGTLVDTTIAGLASTDNLPQGSSNLYLSTNGGTTLQSATGSITSLDLPMFSGTSGLIQDAGVSLADLTLQYFYNNDPGYPISQIALASGGEIDFNSSTDIAFGAVYGQGIVTQLGLKILPTDNTEAFRVLQTTDPTSTLAEMISTTRGVVGYPAMSAVDEAAIPTTSAPKGLGVFDTDTNVLDLWTGSSWINLVNTQGTVANAQNILTNSAFNNLSFYPTFVASAGGGLQMLRFNTTFNFNPATGVFTTPNLVLGALSANQLVGLNSGKIAASIGAGTSTQVLHGNASGLPTWSALNLSTDATGTLGFGNGGLGFTTATTGDLFLATATNTAGKLSAVASGSVLASAGTGIEPTWSSSPTLTGLNLSGLIASQAVVTDSSKNLASLGYGSTNTASTLVERDGSGNFSAGTITAALSGNANTATTATNAQNVGTLLTTTNSTFFIPFVTSNATTNQPIEVNSQLTINPATGLLTSTSLTLAAANNLNLGTNTNNALTINSASGAPNTADLVLNRNDSTNGNNRVIYRTAGSNIWSVGDRSGGSNYTIFDEANLLAQVTVAPGSGTTGGMTLAGYLIVGQPGQFSLQLPNGGGIAAKNSGGTLETWCYPRFTNNITYCDIGSGGMVMRQDAAGTTWETVDTSGNVSFSQGNVLVTTVGKTLSIATGSNACAGTGVTLSSGAATISSTCIVSGDIIFLMKTANGGTSTTGVPSISVTTGSATLTSDVTNTSTYSWIDFHT